MTLFLSAVVGSALTFAMMLSRVQCAWRMVMTVRVSLDCVEESSDDCLLRRCIRECVRPALPPQLALPLCRPELTRAEGSFAWATTESWWS